MVVDTPEWSLADPEGRRLSHQAGNIHGRFAMGLRGAQRASTPAWARCARLQPPPGDRSVA